MNSSQLAIDLHPYPFEEKEQTLVAQWFPPPVAPKGPSHGSAAICFTPDKRVVLGSADGESWETPGGRPESGEGWRDTLEREVLEEVCASVEKATLLGFIRGECLTGPESGKVLVRAIWAAEVMLHPWEPQHEIVHRRVVAAEQVLGMIKFPAGQLPIYERWIKEAIAALA